MDDGDPLQCENCGAAITNEGLVTGACTHCHAAVVLPNDPGKKNQGRIISKAGDDMVLRVDSPDGMKVHRVEGVVWDPDGTHRAEEEKKEAAAAAAARQKGNKTALFVTIAIVVVFVGIAAFQFSIQ